MDDVTEVDSRIGWIFLSLFLFLMLVIMTSFYTSSIATRVDPRSCPTTAGSYGVEAGVTASVLGTCNNKPCTFTVDSIAEAINLCDADAARCSSFYYDGINMSYLETTSSRIIAPPGGIYTRQVQINRD